jgi:hypothetical protein
VCVRVQFHPRQPGRICQMVYMKRNITTFWKGEAAAKASNGFQATLPE